MHVRVAHPQRGFRQELWPQDEWLCGQRSSKPVHHSQNRALRSYCSQGSALGESVRTARPRTGVREANSQAAGEPRPESCYEFRRAKPASCSNEQPGILHLPTNSERPCHRQFPFALAVVAVPTKALPASRSKRKRDAGGLRLTRQLERSGGEDFLQLPQGF